MPLQEGHLLILHGLSRRGIIGAMIRLYNTLTRQKEELPDSKELHLFVCGPTVYDNAHIGHARTYIFFDFLAKYLRSQGRKVVYLQNITDVDDKIIKRAAEAGISTTELALKFTKSYFEDMKTLGVDSVDEYAPATKFIPEIIGQVERLTLKGFAYKIDGDGWYFDISKDPDYGKLSGRTAAQAEDATSRIDESVQKRNRGDFCLWKFSKPDEPTWPAETLGAGRPGWHIEDTAITEHFFGPHYDIHGGAVDLKFPHHEAEIAQQTAAAGIKPEDFVKIWVHTGFLTVNGEKMSKSLGNFVTIKDFLKKYPAEVLRLMAFTHHYRSPMDYSEKLAEETYKKWQDIQKFLGRLEFVLEKKKMNDEMTAWPEGHRFSRPVINQASLDDDLNTPQALSTLLFATINYIEKEMEVMHFEDLKADRDFIKDKLSLFGLSPQIPRIPVEIQAKAAQRELCRGNKDFAQSDALRKEIDEIGYVIEDTPVGPFVWPKA
jgi:cysteinyl-tRNA synthetase